MAWYSLWVKRDGVIESLGIDTIHRRSLDIKLRGLERKMWGRGREMGKREMTYVDKREGKDRER